jgi:2-amino-4-hydroxy-6-hydroxymethyldihydropteridine diphosphokinase
MIRAYIALGSNQQNPLLQIKKAILEIAEIPHSKLLKTSSLYRTPPVGFIEQPHFINAAAQIDTSLSAIALLSALFEIENKHQRVRNRKNGPRTLDLDLLLYGRGIINSEILQVPHPRMKERMFVVYPLLEIDPTLLLPCGTSIITLFQAMLNNKSEIVLDKVIDD